MQCALRAGCLISLVHVLNACTPAHTLSGHHTKFWPWPLSVCRLTPVPYALLVCSLRLYATQYVWLHYLPAMQLSRFRPVLCCKAQMQPRRLPSPMSVLAAGIP